MMIFFALKENGIEIFTTSSFCLAIEKAQPKIHILLKDSFECNFYPNRNRCSFSVNFLLF